MRARPVLLVLSSLLLAVPALGQPMPALPIAEPATQGVRNPTVGVASDADASSLERNPAMLGYLRSWSGVYLHSEVTGGGTVGGEGDGFFFASPLPWVSALVAGAGVQSIRPPAGFPYGDVAKISLALAWRLHPAFSLGLHYAHLASSDAPVAGGVDTLDLGLGGRLGRFIGYGLVVRDVPSPSVGGLPLQRVYDPELAVRPLGSDRLEIAIGARFGERRGDVDPHFRIWAVAYKGVSVKADVEWRRDLDLDGILENDVRAALGLQLDLERFGVAGYGLVGREQGRTRGQGFTIAARVSGERYPTFYRGNKYLERVELTRELRGRRLLEVLDRLRAIEHDEATAGVLLIGGELGAGWAAAEELRAALLRLRRGGKHVLAFLTHADTRGYVVATAAERLLMDPAGDLALTGHAVTLPFFKGTGEQFGIRGEFVRIGAYKSAPERYTQAGPSPESLASRETYLDDLQRHMIDAIATSRGLDPATARRRLDGGPYAPDAAQRAGLLDEVRAAEELPLVFERVIGAVVAVRDATRAPARPDSWSIPEIAVLHLEGDLISGPSRHIPLLELRATGLSELVTALDQQVNDPRVKAIVVRIDSPGGSSMAADLLAREIERARQVKPVVCSLGDVAASGGYYAAAGCEEIFAAPSTLTGSIGIYTGKFDVSGLLAKLGVTLAQLGRGAHAGMESPFRPYTDDERQSLLGLLRYHYDRFVARGARGRGKPPAEIEGLAEGRVYSGERARALGLVDHHGGLREAIDAAARRAGVRGTLPIRFVPERPTILGQLGRLLGLRLPRGTPQTNTLPTIEELLQLMPSSLVFEPSLPQARLEP
jgi:protease IV